MRDQGIQLSKNLKILGAMVGALALLFAAARLFVAENLEDRFPAQAPATLLSGAEVRLESAPSAPVHVAKEDATEVGESRPPLRPARVIPVEQLDSVDKPARRGLRRVFRARANLSLVAFGPEDGGSVGKDDRPVQWIDKASMISFDSHLRTVDLGADGFPSAALDIRRVYEHATCTFRQSTEWDFLGTSNPVLSGTSHLEGASVIFTWDAGAGDYRAKVVSRHPDTDLDRLHALAMDLDLAALRPPAQAGTGYRWTMPASALDGVIRPGGDLQFVYGRDLAPKGCSVALWTSRQPATAELEGTVQAIVKGRKELDGRQLVAIELEATVRSSCLDGAFPFKVELELAGDLLWDFQADRAYALEAKGTMEVVIAPRADTDDDSGSVRLHSAVRFRGEAEFRLETTLVE